MMQEKREKWLKMAVVILAVVMIVALIFGVSSCSGGKAQDPAEGEGEKLEHPVGTDSKPGGESVPSQPAETTVPATQENPGSEAPTEQTPPDTQLENSETMPVKPTEPAPAVPKPTVPATTQPTKPVDPPKPTEPTPTEPRPTEPAETVGQEEPVVSYDPVSICERVIAKCQAGGMITTTDNLAKLLSEGKITQEEYDSYYPYDGLGYYSVFVETDLNKASTTSGRKLGSEEAIAEHIAEMLLLENDPIFYIEYAGIYTLNGTDFYEFRCYR